MVAGAVASPKCLLLINLSAQLQTQWGHKKSVYLFDNDGVIRDFHEFLLVTHLSMIKVSFLSIFCNNINAFEDFNFSFDIHSCSDQNI